MGSGSTGFMTATGFCNRAFVVKRNFQREANGQTGRLASMVCVVGD
jgi:hypothetical protein